MSKQTPKPERKYTIELLWTVSSALVPFGWELVTGAGIIEVFVGWILWLVPFSLGMRLFWRWTTDHEWRLRGRMGLSLLAISGFVSVAFSSINLVAHPTFMYFVPGLTMDDNASRSYAPQFNGDQPLFNVSVTITDQSALETAKKENRLFPGNYWEIPLYRPRKR